MKRIDDRDKRQCQDANDDDHYMAKKKIDVWNKEDYSTKYKRKRNFGPNKFQNYSYINFFSTLFVVFHLTCLIYKKISQLNWSLLT